MRHHHQRCNARPHTAGPQPQPQSVAPLDGFGPGLFKTTAIEPGGQQHRRIESDSPLEPGENRAKVPTHGPVRQIGNRASRQRVGRIRRRAIGPQTVVELVEAGHPASGNRDVEAEAHDPGELPGGDHGVAFVEPEGNPPFDAAMEREVGEFVAEHLKGILAVGPDQNRSGTRKREPRAPLRRPPARHLLEIGVAPDHDQRQRFQRHLAEAKPFPGTIGGLREGNGQIQLGRAADRGDAADADGRKRGGSRGLGPQAQGDESTRGTDPPRSSEASKSRHRWAHGANRLASAPFFQVATAVAWSPPNHWARPSS